MAKKITDWSQEDWAAAKARADALETEINTLMASDAYKGNAPLVTKGKSVIDIDETTTIPAGPNTPGQTNTKKNVTTSDADIVYTDTAGPQAIRGSVGQKQLELAQLRAAIADPANNIIGGARKTGIAPMGMTEAMDIGGSILAENPNAKAIQEALARIKAYGGTAGNASLQGLGMILEGVEPNRGLTWLRTLPFMDPRSNPKLLAELMLNENAALGSNALKFEDLREDLLKADQYSPQGLLSSLEQGSANDLPSLRSAVSSAGQGLDKKAMQLASGEVHMRHLMEAADRKITKNRRTLGGVLAGTAAVGEVTRRALKDDPSAMEAAIKWSDDSELHLFGPGRAPTKNWEAKDPAGRTKMLEDAFDSYLATEWSDANAAGKAKRQMYNEVMMEHRPTLDRLGKGTLKVTDTGDEGLDAFKLAMEALVTKSKRAADKPIIFPWGDPAPGMVGGFLGIDKGSGKLTVLTGNKGLKFE